MEKKKKNRNVKKDAKFTDKSISSSQRLYGLEPIWKVTLKIASTGLLMSFFLGLFTFADQLMLVNFMPNTHNFSFNELFYKSGAYGYQPTFHHTALSSPFTPLIDSLNNTTLKNAISKEIGGDGKVLPDLINSIGNATGLGFINSSSIVRSAVSLTVALSIVLNSIPSIFSVGTSIKYTQALGKGDYKTAIRIWQNSFIGSIYAGLFCFVLLIILIPTVVPVQDISHILTKENMDQLRESLSVLFTANHWSFDHFITEQNGQYIQTLYFTQNGNNFTYYIQVGNNEYVDISSNEIYNLTSADVVHNLASLQSVQYTLINTNNWNQPDSIFIVWKNYEYQIRQYTIIWAEQFLFILDAGAIILSLANLLLVILRSEGAIAISTTITVVTVCINILLDYIFIKIAQIGMEGASTASVIGYLLQFIWASFYLQYSTKIKSHLSFKALNKKYMSVHFKIMFELILFGLSMVVGTTMYSVSNIILTNQITDVSSQILVGSSSEYYLSILGAINPFLALFFSTIFGIVRSNSQIFSYNYSAKKYGRIREAYWWNFGLILSLALLILGLFGFCVPIRDELLSWFQINKSSPDEQLVAASKLMWVWLTELPSLAFATGGMLIYRSTNRIGTAYLVSLLRSGLWTIPVIFIFAAIAVNCKNQLNDGVPSVDLAPANNNAMWFFMYNEPVSTACFGLTIFIMTTIFIYKYMENPRPISKIWPVSTFKKIQMNKIYNESIIR